MQTASIINVLGQYPGLKWEDLVSPEYPTPEILPLYVRCANKLIMGTGGTPTIPLFIGQGANGGLEGTPCHKEYGAGDGVMIAGDVRTLASSYCERGNTAVWYEQYDEHSHITSLLLGPWLPHSIAWIKQRFKDQPPLPIPQNCSSLPEGTSLDPIEVQPSAASSLT